MAADRPVFLVVPPVPALLGHAFPSPVGWALAALAVPAVLLADLMHKRLTRRAE